MLLDSHKIIAREIGNHVSSTYQINLNEKFLVWGSISPDFLPKYRLIRHYKDESLGFVTNELIKIILLIMNTDFSKGPDSFRVRSLSRRIGNVSHYLADYTTHPHARRITCVTKSSAREHLNYESELNKFIKDHEFDLSHMENWELSNFDGSFSSLRYALADVIDHVVNEYLEQEIEYGRDLDYAMNLNLFIMEQVFEAAFALSGQVQTDLL